MSDLARSIPPLDDHLQSIRYSATKMAKVYDFLLGEFVRYSIDTCLKPQSGHIVYGPVCINSESIITLLAATVAYPDLPNRKALIELVEAAMPKEEK